VNVVGPQQRREINLARDLLKSAAYVTLDDDPPADRWKRILTASSRALSDQAKDSRLAVVINEVQRAHFAKTGRGSY